MSLLRPHRSAARAVAFVVSILSLLLLSMGLLVGASSCGRSSFEDNFDSGTGDSSADTPDIPPSSIVSIRVDPANPTIPRGGVQSLRAIGTKTDGTTADITSLCAWTSSDPSVASVAGGVVTANAGGKARITASYGTASGDANVVVPTADLVDLRVSPPFADIPSGTTVTFSAIAYFSDSSTVDVTAIATWTTSDASVANVKAGLVVGVGAGKALISAQFGGRTSTATVSVSTGKVLKAVEISPFSPTVGLAVTVNLTATAIYTDGTKADVTTTSTWASSDDKIASVDATGVVTGNSEGSAIVSATFSGVTGTTPITVKGCKLLGIAISPTAATISTTGSVTLSATANCEDGTSFPVTTTATWKSSDTSIATVSAGLVKGAGVGAADISATFSGVSGTAKITVSAAKLLSITITPADASLPKGGSISYKATGIYEGGSTRDITNDVAWSTDDATIATVSNATGSKGLATPGAIGKTTVKATLDGITGSTSVTVTAATITSITIAPSPLAMIQGTKAFATASAKYSDGTTLDVTTTCTWSTAAGGIATVSNAAGSQGQVTAVGVGSTTLSCAQSGVTGSATVTVTGPTLDQVQVSPVAPTCHIGDTLQFQAFAVSTSGTTSNVTFAATWSSSASTIVQLLPGPPGRFRCLAKGTATVSATYGGKTGSTPVTVSDATPVSIQIDPVAITMPIGTVQQYQAVAIYSDGTNQNVTFAATWLSTDASVASVGNAGFNKGQVTALKPGSTKIQATWSGLTGSTTLTVSAAVVTSISVSPAVRAVPNGFRFQYTAQAIYSDGSSKDVTTLATWTSSAIAVAAVSDGFGTKGQCTALSPGSTTITATYSGIKGTASLTVTSAKLTIIQVTPFKPVLPVGFGIRLRATGIYDDGSTEELTPFATWLSSDDKIAAVSDAVGAKGTVTPIAAGSATIKASYGGMTGTDVVTVTSATLSSIAITPASPSVAAGSNVQLTATGTFSDGSTLDITVYVAWTSSDTSIGDVSNAPGDKGDAYGFKAGSTTITAQRGTVKGTETLTVK